MRLDRGSPSPVPSAIALPVRTRPNSRSTRGMSCATMPGPVSCTLTSSTQQPELLRGGGPPPPPCTRCRASPCAPPSTCALPSSRSTDQRSRTLPCCVNLHALPSMLPTTCSSPDCELRTHRLPRAALGGVRSQWKATPRRTRRCPRALEVATRSCRQNGATGSLLSLESSFSCTSMRALARTLLIVSRATTIFFRS